MSERIRFHLDEHIDPSVARALRRHGIDVTTTNEAGLRARDDESQLRFARAHRRVIVTRDRDFLRLAAEGRHHPGIIFCPTTYEVGEMVRGLMLIHEVLTAEELIDGRGGSQRRSSAEKSRASTNCDVRQPAYVQSDS